ncbi:putative reverse transcriptase domain-containing protein [Tanacetum coccineum]|uniref:Reverse transcriptase domain-containing protein n=1 Tax=Tanacetum coccineum TaxID=301880 RepID=A0ABQ5ERP2_9ASTR
MACLLPHTVDEIHALVQKRIHEDSVRQKAMMDLAVQFDNASAAKQDLRQAYEKCNDIPQETRNLIDAFLKRESDKDYEINLAMYRKAGKIEKQIEAKYVWLSENTNSSRMVLQGDTYEVTSLLSYSHQLEDFKMMDYETTYALQKHKKSVPTQSRMTLRIASTQALIDAVTAALPSPPLPPLPPSLYIPPPIDRKDDIPESEQPPRKRLCLSTLGSRYEIGESSTARPTRGRGIDYGFVSTVDAEERRQGIRDVGYSIRDTWVDPAEAFHEIVPMTVGEVNTRVTELAELHKHDTQDLYALLEDAQDSRSRISQRVDMDSQRVDLLIGDRMTLQETIWMVEEEAYASLEDWAHSIGLSQATHQELQTHRDHVYAYETHLQAHQTQLKLQGTLIQTQHQVHETRFQMHHDEIAVLQETDRRRQAQMQQRRARQPAPDARIPDHQDASGDADSHATCSHGDNRRNVQTARPCYYADFMKCQPLNFKGTEGVVGLTQWIKKMESVFNISGCAIKNQVKFSTYTLLGDALTWWNGQIRTLGLEAYAMTWEVLKKKMTNKYCPQGEIKKLEIELWNLKFIANESEKVDKYISGLPDNIYGNVKSARPKTLDEIIELANDLMDQKFCTYAERQSDKKRKADDSSRNNHGHQQQPFKRQNVAKVYNMGTCKKKPYGGSLPKCTKCHFYHNGPCTQKCHKCNKVGHFARDYRSTGNTNVANTQKGNGAAPKGNGCFECGALRHFKRDCPKLKNKDGGNGNAQGWVYAIGNAEKRGNASGNPDSNVVTGRNERESQLAVISYSKAQEYMAKGCQVFLAQISGKKEEDKLEGKQIKDVPIVRDFPEVFPEDLPGLLLARPMEFHIDLILGATPVARAPYRLAPSEMKELSEQLQDLSDKGFIRPSSSP